VWEDGSNFTAAKLPAPLHLAVVAYQLVTHLNAGCHCSWCLLAYQYPDAEEDRREDRQKYVER
jgi:hypothetical protein